MLIGIMSDSHDHMDRIRQATRVLVERGVTTIIHAGDFVAPFALIPLVEAKFRLFAVFGNNDGEFAGLRRIAAPLGGIHPGPYRFELDGMKFLVNHTPLSSDKINTEQAVSDFIVCGHTHIVEHRRLGTLTLINPGELCGWLKGRATIAILDTASRQCEFIDL